MPHPQPHANSIPNLIAVRTPHEAAQGETGVHTAQAQHSQQLQQETWAGSSVLGPAWGWGEDKRQMLAPRPGQGMRALPSEVTSSKVSSITVWYSCLWASSRSSHSSLEKCMATSSKATRLPHEETARPGGQ